MQEEFMKKVLENFEKVFKKLEEHDKRFDKSDEKFDMVFKKLEEHDESFKKSDEKLNKNMEEISIIFKDLIKREDERYEMLHNSLLVIEDRVSRELPALFDGLQISIEKNTDLDIRHNSLEEKVEFNSQRISSLEDISEIHEEQLSKLLARNS